MPLVLNEEQQMLKDAAAGFLAEKATVAHLRALRDSSDELGFDTGTWAEMAQMGWAGIAIPEEFGGLVRYIMAHTPNIDQAVLSVHCHNDLGLATANTVAAIKAGADLITAVTMTYAVISTG